MLQCTVHLRKRTYVESRVKEFEEHEKLLEPPHWFIPLQPGDIDNLPAIARAILHSGDPKQELIGFKWVVRFLSHRQNPPIGLIFKSGILPKCIELLTNARRPHSRTQAASILANIAAGGSKYVKKLIELGALDPLLQLLYSETPWAVADQVVWAVGSIAGDGPRTRDLVSSERTIQRLVQLTLALTEGVDRRRSPSIVGRLARTLNNCFKESSKKQPTVVPIATVRQILPALTRLINLSDGFLMGVRLGWMIYYGHVEAISQSCLALARLTFRSDEGIDEVLNTDGMARRLLYLLVSPSEEFASASLRVIDNILRGTPEQANRMLNAGPLIERLGRLMESNQPLVVRDSALVTSSISCMRDQINRVIDGGLVPILLKVAQAGTPEAKQYAVFAITNIANSCTPNHIEFMCENGGIPTICSAFKFKFQGCNDRIVVAMQALARILILTSAEGDAERISKYRESVVDCGGLASLEQLQIDNDKHEKKSQNNDIYNVARAIVDNFFREEEEVADVKAAKMQKLD